MQTHEEFVHAALREGRERRGLWFGGIALGLFALVILRLFLL